MIDKKVLIDLIIERNALKSGKTFVLTDGSISNVYFNISELFYDGFGIKIICKNIAFLLYQTKLLKENTVLFAPIYRGALFLPALAQKIFDIFGISFRWFTIRKEIKTYGDKEDKLIIGKLYDNDKIIIIDDVLTNGITKIKYIHKIKALNPNVTINAIVVLLDRSEEKVKEMFLQNYNIKVYSVLTLEDFNIKDKTFKLPNIEEVEKAVQEGEEELEKSKLTWEEENPTYYLYEPSDAIKELEKMKKEENEKIIQKK